MLLGILTGSGRMMTWEGRRNLAARKRKSVNRMFLPVIYSLVCAVFTARFL